MRDDASSTAGEEPRTVEAVLADVGLGPFQSPRLLVLCSLLLFGSAAAISMLSFLTACVTGDWALSSTQELLMEAAMYGSQLVGALSAGALADVYGRRLACIASCGVAAVAALLSAVAPSVAVLFALRVLCGLGVGGITVPIVLLLELLPTARRGRVALTLVVGGSLGRVYTTAAAAATLRWFGWRAFCVLASLPGVAAACVGYMNLPNSPRWLMARGREREARALLAHVAKANLGTAHHAVALGPLAHAPWAVSPAPSFKDIFAPVLWGTTVCVHTMQVSSESAKPPRARHVYVCVCARVCIVSIESQRERAKTRAAAAAAAAAAASPFGARLSLSSCSGLATSQSSR